MGPWDPGTSRPRTSASRLHERTRLDRLQVELHGGEALLDRDAERDAAIVFRQPHAHAAGPLLAARSSDMLKLLKRLKSAPDVDDAYPFGEYHHVVLNKNYNRDDLKKYIVQEQPDVELVDAKPDIEDCFMNLMKSSDE